MIDTKSIEVIIKDYPQLKLGITSVRVDAENRRLTLDVVSSSKELIPTSVETWEVRYVEGKADTRIYNGKCIEMNLPSASRSPEGVVQIDYP